MAYVVASRSGHITDVSRRAEQLCGWSSAELRGESLEKLFAGSAVLGAVQALGCERQLRELPMASLRQADGGLLPVQLELLQVTTSDEVAIILRPVQAAGGQLYLQRALEQVTDGFVVYDHEWRFRYLNRSAERYWGRPREGLLGRTLWEVFPQALGSPLEPHLRQAMATGRPEEFELISPVSGRWIGYRLFPAEDGLFSYFRDVTARKSAENALRESEARYRSLFDHSLQATFLTTPDGRILSANPAACRILGRTEEEICRLGRGAVIDLEDPRLPRLLEERARTGYTRGELTCLRADGTKFPGEISSAVFRTAAGELRTSLVVHDLTEQRHAEEALRLIADAGAELTSSLDFETTIRNVVELVVSRVADMCLVDLIEGDSIRRVAVHHRDPAIAETLSILKTRPVRSHATTGTDNVIRTGRSELIPFVTDEWLRTAVRSPDRFDAVRGIGMTSLLIVPLNVRGQTIGALTLGQTGTGRRFTENDLSWAQGLADRAALAIDHARLYAAAVEAKRLRDEVLSVVSHDLRSPLASISLYAGLLQRMVRTEHPEKIHQAVARAERLIEDLLVTAKIEAGHLAVERTPEEPTSILEEVIELHRPQAEARAIHLAFECVDGLPLLAVDRHRLVQALSNLVSNAIKFTPARGTVSVQATAIDGRLVISVRDTGPGIPPEQLPHLFDRFWQGAHARRAGAGLGLAIVKGIVEAHGGRIDVESEVGSGATFTLSLSLPQNVAEPVGPGFSVAS